MKVFIADDSRIIRKRIIAMLSEAVHVSIIGQAGNVHDAIDRIRELRPDVIILDIRMPGGSGMDVLRQIDRTDKESVVIMLTNYPQEQYQKRCLEAGADFFFNKSSEFERVVEVVKSMDFNGAPRNYHDRRIAICQEYSGTLRKTDETV
jgi:DNA-binding NarL/FixJ family response regulator